MEENKKFKDFYVFILFLSNSAFVFFIFPIAYDIIETYNSEVLGIINTKNGDSSAVIYFGITLGVRNLIILIRYC